MILPASPLLSTLTALALWGAGPAHADWLDDGAAAIHPVTATAGQDELYSYLDRALTEGDPAAVAQEAAWVLAHLAGPDDADRAPVLIEGEQATPPLSAARAEDVPSAGRPALTPTHPPAALGAGTALPPARADAGLALPDPAWIASAGAVLALVSWLLRRKPRRVNRPPVLYVTR